MQTKLLTFFLVIGLTGVCAVRAQSPSPEVSASAAESQASPAASAAEESPSPAEKKARKKKAAVSPTAAPTASPAKKTLADIFKPKISPSPAAATTKTSTKGETVAKATPAPGGGHGLVWVNTETHVYHKEGSRFYGKTKSGKYVSEADAIKEGDRPAKNE
jgi:hypothetical protein